MHCDALLCRCAEGRDYNKDGRCGMLQIFTKLCIHMFILPRKLLQKNLQPIGISIQCKRDVGLRLGYPVLELD